MNVLLETPHPRSLVTFSASREPLHVKDRETVTPVGTVSYPRAYRKSQIEEQVALSQSLNKKPLTMRQIAKRIKMSPGGHLMEILWEMAEEQRLIASPRDYRADMKAWDFKLPPDRVSSVLQRVYEVAR